MSKKFEHIIKTEIVVKSIIDQSNNVISQETYSTIIQNKISPLEENAVLEKKDYELGYTEAKYGILSGKDLEVFNSIPAGSNVEVIFNDESYVGKRHITQGKRIDGLSKLYRDSGLKKGDLINIKVNLNETSPKVIIEKTKGK